MIESEEFCTRYLEFLNGPLSGLNLTRITEPNDFKIKQYIDSVQPVYQAQKFKEHIAKTSLLLDIGFGGGFPILPLANEMGEVRFIGFEARKKKAEAVNKIAEFLGFTNVSVNHERLENIWIDEDCAITFKAVSSVKNCLNMINTDKNVLVGIYKGPAVFSDEGKDLEALKGWKLIEQNELVLEDNSVRNFLVLQNVPRGTKSNKPSKNIVKLSHFL